MSDILCKVNRIARIAVLGGVEMRRTRDATKQIAAIYTYKKSYVRSESPQPVPRHTPFPFDIVHIHRVCRTGVPYLAATYSISLSTSLAMHLVRLRCMSTSLAKYRLNLVIGPIFRNDISHSIFRFCTRHVAACT